MAIISHVNMFKQSKSLFPLFFYIFFLGGGRGETAIKPFFRGGKGVARGKESIFHNSRELCAERPNSSLDLPVFGSPRK